MTPRPKPPFVNLRFGRAEQKQRGRLMLRFRISFRLRRFLRKDSIQGAGEGGLPVILALLLTARIVIPIENCGHEAFDAVRRPETPLELGRRGIRPENVGGHDGGLRQRVEVNTLLVAGATAIFYSPIVPHRDKCRRFEWIVIFENVTGSHIAIANFSFRQVLKDPGDRSILSNSNPEAQDL